MKCSTMLAPSMTTKQPVGAINLASSKRRGSRWSSTVSGRLKLMVRVSIVPTRPPFQSLHIRTRKVCLTSLIRGWVRIVPSSCWSRRSACSSSDIFMNAMILSSDDDLLLRRGESGPWLRGGGARSVSMSGVQKMLGRGGCVLPGCAGALRWTRGCVARVGREWE